DGRVLGTYHKTHPIQFFSDGVPGRTYPTFRTAVGRIGIAICYDFDFAACPLRLVQNGAELLVAPTFDSGEWTDVQHTQHARMAQARAAETGRWVIRATTSGVSQVINPSGFVTAVIWSGEPDTTMGLAVPQRTQTLYMRVLHLLPMVCLVISTVWLIMLATVTLTKRRGDANDTTSSL
ncbi:MAG TPA: nitrilase-related carbon-nitrogen hydrolase, partial [Armatimonadota bacterium]|nr:nitrilase-related carbon-nitrogen hydrolase [Armatimonadota bacterium]